ncbi:hypothetical protein CLV42_110134 [Chitinophaga ginsengisoli]|uniref:Uncharacterized protein n=1 Tax=Chitinophaga ginsengisoli TaxID=363837 RepID=A0A2P8FZ27_9BACT|nr:hypothetical protein CLV42_110134 [Chitinophaga ginsengisoli]
MAQCITKLAEQNDYPESFIDEVKGWQIAYVNDRCQTVTFIVRTCVVFNSLLWLSGNIIVDHIKYPGQFSIIIFS